MAQEMKFRHPINKKERVGTKELNVDWYGAGTVFRSSCHHCLHMKKGLHKSEPRGLTKQESSFGKRQTERIKYACLRDHKTR